MLSRRCETNSEAASSVLADWNSRMSIGREEPRPDALASHEPLHHGLKLPYLSPRFSLLLFCLHRSVVIPFYLGQCKSLTGCDLSRRVDSNRGSFLPQNPPATYEFQAMCRVFGKAVLG